MVIFLVIQRSLSENVSSYPGDKLLKTSSEKPIKQRLLIRSLQAALLMVSHTEAVRAAHAY